MAKCVLSVNVYSSVYFTFVLFLFNTKMNREDFSVWTSSQRQVLRSRSIIVKFNLHWKIQLHDNSYTSALEADWLSLRQYQMGVATPLSPYTCKFLQIKVIVIISHQKGTLSFFSRFYDTKGIHFSSICNSAGTFVYKFTFTFAKSTEQVTLFRLDPRWHRILWYRIM